MRIYIMQHGEAEPKDVDPDRPLTKQGRRDIESMAGTLARSGVRVERVLHSGKTRARQTAELMAQRLTGHGEADTRARLGPNDPVDELISELDNGDGEILVVGHMPYVSRLVSELVAGDEQHPVVDYVPGSVVCLDRATTEKRVVVWAIRPGLC